MVNLPHVSRFDSLVIILFKSDSLDFCFNSHQWCFSSTVKEAQGILNRSSSYFLKNNLTFMHSSCTGSLLVTKWLLGVSYPVWQFMSLKECDILDWKASRSGSVINTKFFSCVVGSCMLVIASQWPEPYVPPWDSNFIRNYYCASHRSEIWLVMYVVWVKILSYGLCFEGEWSCTV